MEVKNEKNAADAETKTGIFRRLFKKDKKKLQIALAAVLIGVVLLIYFSSLFPGKGDSGAGVAAEDLTVTEYCAKVRDDLEDFLSRIKGAGKVKALINFESSAEIVIAYITSGNKNSNIGEDGKLNENGSNTSTPVILNVNGVQTPLILKYLYPKALSVVIGAEGAGAVSVKLALLDAARVFLKVEAANVQVYTLK